MHIIYTLYTQTCIHIHTHTHTHTHTHIYIYILNTHEDGRLQHKMEMNTKLLRNVRTVPKRNSSYFYKMIWFETNILLYWYYI